MYEGIRVSAMAAVARNGTIGRDGHLPWRIRDDLRHFRRHTLGHACVMGRRTLDELGRPLERRLNVVLSRSLVREEPGLVVVRGLTEALSAAAGWERRARAAGRVERAEIFVIGGAMVWAAAWPRVDRLYLTRVLGDIDGDTVFPDVDLGAFREVEQRPGEGEPPHDFLTLERR